MPYGNPGCRVEREAVVSGRNAILDVLYRRNWAVHLLSYPLSDKVDNLSGKFDGAVSVDPVEGL